MPRILLLSALLACALPCLAEEIPEVADSGLPTPDAALAALRARAEVEIVEHEQWIVANDRADSAIWTFTRPGNAAHPSVVRRRLVEVDGNIAMQMAVNCGASKETCDHLVSDFQALNEQMAAEIRERQGAAAPAPAGAATQAEEPSQ